METAELEKINRYLKSGINYFDITSLNLSNKCVKFI